MKQASHQLTVDTPGRGFTDITREIASWTSHQAVDEGLLTLFIRHTSASLMIQENADPDVLRDMADFLERLAPEDKSAYRHDAEGPDDMPAHLKMAVTQTHLTIPVSGGRPVLGTWQGVFLCEHRRQPHRRTVALHLMGQ